jgi:hypothetical protein
MQEDTVNLGEKEVKNGRKKGGKQRKKEECMEKHRRQ